MVENTSAFPVPNDANVNGDMGMTLRDWLAGQALTGLMLKDPWGDPAMHASYAYNAADALLAARQKGGEA